MNPTSWSTSDVEDWARRVGLPECTITGSVPLLVTLEKDELRPELGISSSLPARRYLWDLIVTLRKIAPIATQQSTSSRKR